MKPIAFRVEMYKGVVDSGWVEIDSLTVIVGKNESGKTTLLKALHKFKPFRDEPYQINREWPRGHRRSQDPKRVVCTVRFRLEESEREALGEFLDEVSAPELVEIGRSYDGNFVLADADCFPERPSRQTIEDKLGTLPEMPADASADLVRWLGEVTNEVRERVESGPLSELTPFVDDRRRELKSRIQEGNGTDETFATAYLSQLREAAVSLAVQTTVRRGCLDHLKKRIPTFIYMDDYRSFQGSVMLDQLSQRQSQNQLTEQDRTVLMLMDLSGLKLAEVLSKSAADERQYDLSDAGRSLTNDIATRWTQRSYEVDFRADGNRFMTFVKDENDPSLIPLEDRSKGFQWFFSFDLMLMYETRGTFKDAVLLLDEPGLHLHPEAQRDLVHRLEKYAEGNTLVYSTHMPFMLNLRHPERIRVISETPDGGTVVRSDLTQSQKEAKFVLQAALGVSGSQSYLLSQRNLVVEGVDDYWVVTELSNLLRRSGEPGLPDDMFITPAGGASEAAYIATFMIGQQLDVAVLLDTDGSGEEAHDKLVKTWLACYQENRAEVMLLGKVVGSSATAFAIEDLFTDEHFVNLVSQVYKKELTAVGTPDLLPLPPGGLLWRRVSEALAKHGIAYGSGQKGRVAKALRAALIQTESIDQLPSATQDRARKLINRIRDIFPTDEQPTVAGTPGAGKKPARTPRRTK